MDNTALASAFMELFAGLDRAYGVFRLNAKQQNGGKIKGKAATEHAPVTVDLWEKHLAGEQGIGIVPIRDDAKVNWAVIDVDTYPLDHAALEQKLLELRLPLVVVKSKSGGAHLFLFTKEPIAAKVVRARLNQWAVQIGYPGVEVFPKQDELLSESDTGNWLNMPYFDHLGTNLRHAIWDGQPLDAATFIEKVQSRRVTLDALNAFAAHDNDEIFNNGPPCLQHLCKEGFPRGTRNRGLFNLGVLARFAADDNWRDLLDDFNRTYMQPPLSTSEVINTAKSLTKKQYFYTCTLDPIASVCSKEICKTRKYGIGNNADSVNAVQIDSIAKFNSDPPVYLVRVEGQTIQCNGSTLLNQVSLRIAIMDKIGRVVPMLPGKAWEALLNQKLEQAEVIEAPKDADPLGQFMSHLENFCTSRVTANKVDEILLGKPWVDPIKGRTYFRSSDLIKYLEQQHFNEYNERQLWAVLKRSGAEHHQHHIKGKCVTMWSIDSFKPQTEDFDPPSIAGSEL